MLLQQFVKNIKQWNRVLIDVATLALGSRPMQGIARLRAKRKVWESHHMLPRVQKVQRIWENEPHTPKWTPIMGVEVPNGFPNL
jgi:hypothetical protein